MGDILFIAHRIPYPPNRGDKIRSWHILKELSKHATVHVAALVDDEQDWQHKARLQEVADVVLLEPRNASKLNASAKALLTGQSASVLAFSNAQLKSGIDGLLARRPISTVFAYSGQAAQFVPGDPKRRFVMDFVDMDSAKFQGFAEQASGLSAFANRTEAQRLFAFEKATAARADASLFVSEAEAALFRQHTGLGADKVIALENGIDLAHFDPALALPEAPKKAGPLIVFTGQMDYRPNVEAVSAYAKDVLPLIRRRSPDAQFAIVGRAPTAEVRALGGLPGVVVTGEVPDTRVWLAAADIVVAPLKLARGIQNKVLEAMAMARPVIASSAAAEGIVAQELIIADGAEREAEAALALLRDPAAARTLGKGARKSMISRYSWEARLAGLPAILGLSA